MWNQSTSVFAWKWLKLEAESTLARRNASSDIWKKWNQHSTSFNWLDLSSESFNEISIFNRTLRLRAADAGHLFTFFKTIKTMPSLVLVSFDKEQVRAAKLLGLPILN